MKKTMITKKMMALSCVAVMALGMSACGTTKDASETANTATETDGESDTAATADTAAAMTDITNELSTVTGTPDFFAADFGSVDAATALGGKKVMLVAYDSTNDWCVTYVEMAKALYEKIGAVPEITYCDGTTDSWIQAIQNAVNQKYDAIDLFGISDIGQLESAINEAKEAGVYVQDTHGTDLSDTSSNTDVSIGCDYEKAGKLMAMKAIDEVGSVEDLNCLVVADVGWGADDSVREGISSVFDSYGVKYTMADVSITDWTEGIGNAVRNAFVADSSYNAVITYYDNMCIYAVSALQELSVNMDDVVVGSFNGSPGMVDYITDGNMDFDLGESTGWAACHAADCMARYFAQQDVHYDSGFAMYFIDSENINDYLDPDTGKASYAYDGVQDVYLTGYSDLWSIDLTDVFANIE